jgi:hypothetical protein
LAILSARFRVPARYFQELDSSTNSLRLCPRPTSKVFFGIRSVERIQGGTAVGYQLTGLARSEFEKWLFAGDEK